MVWFLGKPLKIDVGGIMRMGRLWKFSQNLTSRQGLRFFATITITHLKGKQ
jgi:hypothetical protein